MVKFISFMVVFGSTYAGPGDDDTRVVRCYSGSASVGYTCGGKYEVEVDGEMQSYFYFSNCKFDDNDYENRPEVVECQAGQQCFTTIKNFNPAGSIVDDVHSETPHTVIAEFGCGDSGRYKGDWTEHHNKFESEDAKTRNKYLAQEAICYPDDTNGDNYWDSEDFSQRDFTCYCLDDECNRQFELPYYIQRSLSLRSRELVEPSNDVESNAENSYYEGSGTTDQQPEATDNNGVTEISVTNEYSYNDDEDLSNEEIMVQ